MVPDRPTTNGQNISRILKVHSARFPNEKNLGVRGAMPRMDPNNLRMKLSWVPKS